MFCLCISLCSCPYSSVYKLDDDPTLPVVNVLLGKWATFVKDPNTQKDEPVKLILSKKNEMEYNVAFVGYADQLRPYHVITADSVKGTAFMSIVDKNQFLNINIKSSIYIAEIKLKDDKLSLFPLVEHFTGKMIFSNDILRKSVEVHYKTRVFPLYDEDFCLKDMVRVN